MTDSRRGLRCVQASKRMRACGEGQCLVRQRGQCALTRRVSAPQRSTKMAVVEVGTANTAAILSQQCKPRVPCLRCAVQVTGATFDKATGLWTVTAASGQPQSSGTAASKGSSEQGSSKQGASQYWEDQHCRHTLGLHQPPQHATRRPSTPAGTLYGASTPLTVLHGCLLHGAPSPLSCRRQGEGPRAGVC